MQNAIVQLFSRGGYAAGVFGLRYATTTSPLQPLGVPLGRALGVL